MRKNCRTIVMAYVNLQSGRIEFLAKSQPSNTDKKQTAEVLSCYNDVSRLDLTRKLRAKRGEAVLFHIFNRL